MEDKDHLAVADALGVHTTGRLVLNSQDDFPTGCAAFEGTYGLDQFVLYHDNAKADARRLVRVWNSHDDLLEALKGVLRVADRATDEFDAARAAIARATKATP